MSVAANVRRARENGETTAGYNHLTVEQGARRRWQDAPGPQADAGASSFTCGTMFPTLSSPLHMGHMRSIVLCDVMARYARMRGANVHQLSGWEAHGIRVRMAAADAGQDPAGWVARCRDGQRAVLGRFGVMADRAHEVTTSGEDHMRRQQETFLALWNAEPPLVRKEKQQGVAYWDRGSRSYLSLRQIVGSRGPESGMLVEVREVSSYEVEVPLQACKKLQVGLESLSGWDAFAKSMQSESIGLEKGLHIPFELRGGDGEVFPELVVFTSRPDTLMGATYMAVGVKHPLAARVSEASAEVRAFCDAVSNPRYAYQKLREEKRQEGIALGAYAINPINGDHIPVWVTNYVVAGYGTGATLGIPGHDQRNHNFAVRHNLPIKRVALEDGESLSVPTKGPFTGKRGKVVNSGGLDRELNELKDGLMASGASGKEWDERVNDCVLGFLRAHGVRAKKATVARLRGWKVSQNEFWGSPVPLVHCPACGTVPVLESDLPVRLPEYEQDKDSLADYPKFVSCACPACGKRASRDTDTLSELFSSSWDRWRPQNSGGDGRDQVDFYCCGVEHATTHLLCARIMGRHLVDVGASKGDGEPFANLLCSGMVLNYGLPMAKWYGNAIEPQLLLDECGADTLRLLLATGADPRHPLHWDDERLFALQGLLSHAEFAMLRDGSLTGIKADLARKALTSSEMSRLRYGLLDRGGLDKLRAGKLDARGKASALEILGERGMEQLQQGFVSASELRALRRGELDPQKMGRVCEILTEAEAIRLQRGLLDEDELRLLAAGKLPEKKLGEAAERTGAQVIEKIAASGITADDPCIVARIQEAFLDEAEQGSLAREKTEIDLLRKARAVVTEDELERHCSGLLDRTEYELLREGNLKGPRLDEAESLVGAKNLRSLQEAALDAEGHRRMLVGELTEREEERVRSVVGAECAGKLKRAALTHGELATLARAAHGIANIESLRSGDISAAKERRATEAAGAELIQKLRITAIDKKALPKLVARVDRQSMNKLVGFIDDDAMSRLVAAVGENGAGNLREIGMAPHRARPLLRCLPPERMSLIADHVGPEKMDRLVNFISAEKMERLLGFAGYLWHLVSSKAHLVAKARGTQTDDPRRQRLNACLKSVEACYARQWPLDSGAGGNLMEMKSLAAKLKEVMRLLDTANSADSGNDVEFSRECCRALLAMAHPVMPHLTEELWQSLGFEGLLAGSRWPGPLDDALESRGGHAYLVQVNGRKRLELTLGQKDAGERAVELARDALAKRAKERGHAGFPSYGEEVAEVEVKGRGAVRVINFVTYRIS